MGTDTMAKKQTAKKQATKKTEKITARHLKGVQIKNWLVLNIAPATDKGNPRWLCRCVNCGLEKTIAESTLIKDRPVACNCSKGATAEVTPEQVKATATAPQVVKATKPSPVKRPRSASKPTVKATLDIRSRLYTIWTNTARKCSSADPTGKYYSQGIRLGKDWQAFSAFYDWAVGQGYSGTQKLARKNARRGFNARNCYFE